jgi:AGZA family xanthine/uracil permease-like MFS transporter
MSYIFLLNPSLLAKAGLDPSAAFFSTVIAAFIPTLMMGIYAGLPYAVAPAPTVTSFFVFYVCAKMHLPWQMALGSVLISGFLSVGATFLSIRERIVTGIPDGLRVGIMFAIGGFLIANGLKLADVPYNANGLDFSKIGADIFLSNDFKIAAIGFTTAAVLHFLPTSVRIAPICGLVIAAIAGSALGVPFGRPQVNLQSMFSSIGSVKFPTTFDISEIQTFVLVTFVFFLIDFYGAIGKFVGLAEVAKIDGDDEDRAIGRALYVDSWGTVAGSLLGTSSVAVFISSAVGVMAGGRTGWSAIYCAVAILASFLLLPIVGSLPTAASAGVLVYIGAILMPWKRLLDISGTTTGRLYAFVAAAAGLLSVTTYAIDRGLLLAFLGGSLILFWSTRRFKDGAIYLYATTTLLCLSVVAQAALGSK